MPGVEDSPELQALLDQAKLHKAENLRLLDKLKKRPPKGLDDAFHTAHDAAFEKIDCLQCANCCKTLSPIFKQKDLERIAKHLKMKPGEFILQYLDMDEDGDFVLKTTPCTFLGPDNYCSIYEVRPEACADYPHTRNRKMHQHIEITKLNSLSCPAVAHIVETLKTNFF